MKTNTIIPTEFAGKRLDIALVPLFPEYSRTQLSEALKKGLILINHLPATPKTKVKGLEEVTFDTTALPHNTTETLLPENIPLTILYEDAHLLVINKPANLTVHPGAGQKTGTLLHGLLFYDKKLEALPRAGLIHRLDKDTTGLLLVAKTQASYLALSEQMRERKICRYYLALVTGKVTLPYTLTTAFGRHAKHRTKMAVKRTGKEATTVYRPLKNYVDPLSKRHYTLLHVELKTGRTHQIRVHMAHIRHAIVGDPVYNQTPALDFKRQALHAYQLGFIHPDTHTPMQFEAPLPNDFETLLQQIQEKTHD